MEKVDTAKEYNEYVNKKSPDSPILKNCFNAFWVGGLICSIGQIIFDFCKFKGLFHSPFPSCFQLCSLFYRKQSVFVNESPCTIPLQTETCFCIIFLTIPAAVSPDYNKYF